jgi:hypothetical protein
MASVEEKVFKSVADETRLLAAEAVAPVRLPFFKGDLSERITQENPYDILKTDISPFMYRVPYVDAATGKAYTNIIGVSVDYDIKMRIPSFLKEKVIGSVCILSRAFVGQSNKGETISFSEMEKDDDSKAVWVFPRSGTKYHEENCRFVANEPREVILTSKVRNNYSPCKLCKPGSASNGSLVYCFTTSGKVFHKGSCNAVDKYVIEISEKEAKTKGYTSCSVCGG